MLFSAVLLCVAPGRAADTAPDLIAPNDRAACLACHAEAVNLHIFVPSAHGKLSCQDCHQGINQYPHPAPAVAHKPLCVTCHKSNSLDVSHSVHGRATSKLKAPLDCQACHGNKAHEIVRPSSVPVTQREAACLSCHRDKATQLASSVHGGSGNRQGMPRPDCLACHGGNPHSIKAPATAARPQNTICLKCHDKNTTMMLSLAHGRALLATDTKLKCLDCHNHNPHAVTPPLRVGGAVKSAMCATCHTKNAEMLAHSAHANADMQGGNRPNCLTCHGTKLHAVLTAAQMTPAQKDAACKSCHTDIAHRLAASVHAQPGKGKLAPTCLSCHGGGNPHAVSPLQALTRTEQDATCERCHADLSPTLHDSVHNRPDKQPGDHPTCLTCHGGDSHGIAPSAHLTPKQKVIMCARCHADETRMARYGRTDAVAAYARTYHGRAILRFGHTKEATCVDCHGQHGILASQDPRARNTPRHAAEICGKCHQKNMTFAFSYAGHLRMNVEKSLMTPLENVLLRCVRSSPFASLLVLLLLAVGALAVQRRHPVLADWSIEAYNGVSMAGVLIGALTLLTLHIMHLLQEPVDARTQYAALLLIIIGLIALAIARIVFPRPSRMTRRPSPGNAGSAK